MAETLCSVLNQGNGMFTVLGHPFVRGRETVLSLDDSGSEIGKFDTFSDENKGKHCLITSMLANSKEKSYR